MPKALLLENIHPDAAKSLRDHGFEVETMKGALSEDELIDALDGVDLVGVRSKTNVTARVLDARPTLKRHRLLLHRHQSGSIWHMPASVASPCSTLPTPTPVPWWNW